MDYQQAQELAPNDKSINLRLSVVYNDLGIMEYKDRKYHRAEEYFSLAISLNITVSAFYLSRARSRYMQEVGAICVQAFFHCYFYNFILWKVPTKESVSSEIY